MFFSWTCSLGLKKRSSLTAAGLIHEYRVSRGEKGPLWIPMGIFQKQCVFFFSFFFFFSVSVMPRIKHQMSASHHRSLTSSDASCQDLNPHISNLWWCSFHPRLDGHHLKEMSCTIFFFLIILSFASILGFITWMKWAKKKTQFESCILCTHLHCLCAVVECYTGVNVLGYLLLPGLRDHSSCQIKI